jgi:hypothetical protein
MKHQNSARSLKKFSKGIAKVFREFDDQSQKLIEKYIELSTNQQTYWKRIANLVQHTTNILHLCARYMWSTQEQMNLTAKMTRDQTQIPSKMPINLINLPSLRIRLYDGFH